MQISCAARRYFSTFLLASFCLAPGLAVAQTDTPAAAASASGAPVLPLPASAAAPDAKPVVDTSPVRIYRRERFFAMGQSFKVEVDGRPIGELPNGSFMTYAASVGAHTVTIKPAGMAPPFSVGLKVEPGKPAYVEFDLNGGLLANSFFAGSETVQRQEDFALAALKTLKEVSTFRSAQPGGGPSFEDGVGKCTAVETPKFPYKITETGWASLNDVGALPADAHKAYGNFLYQPYPRAFAVAANGAWGQSSKVKDAVEVALSDCAQTAKTACYLYAVDGKIVLASTSPAGACWGASPAR